MWHKNFLPFDLKHYNIFSLQYQSKVLRENPLGDPSLRSHYVLLPKKEGIYKAVLNLSGFAGDGAKNFNFKSFEPNLIQEIDEWTDTESISPKIFIFPNLWTFWGGSQFINSQGCGRYEDYIVQELCPFFEKSFTEKKIKVSSWALLGGSSGGYGALHLASKFPELFVEALAVAPDSHFEVSLKPEIYHALPDIEHQGGILEFCNKLKNREIKTNTKSFFTMVNVIAMAACYSRVDKNGMPLLPLEREGGFNEELWEEWLKKDPLYFLEERIENVKKLKTLFLSVGQFDQFLLQFGARKIRKLFLDNNVDFTYEEFKGNHFDIGSRRKKALSLL